MRAALLAFALAAALLIPLAGLFLFVEYSVMDQLLQERVHGECDPEIRSCS